MSRKLLLVVLVGLGLIGGSYWYSTRGRRGEIQVHQGQTMGSTFSVSWVDSKPHPDVPVEIDRVLQRVIDLMSTYDSDSELSRFNRSDSTDWFPVAPELVEVVTIAREISYESHGAFDVTVKPLVQAWGFGPNGASSPPTDAELHAASRRFGYWRLELRDNPPALRKQIPGLELDLNAIAPGYAVDRIAQALEARGITNYLVDVGGEIRVSGEKGGGAKWRIAVEMPDRDARTAESVYEFQNTAIATSGDYRNYYERDGKRVSHTIDPRKGRPIDHNLASVTVLSSSAARADALATALSVLGPDEAYALASRTHLSVLLLVRTAPGTFEHRRTGWFIGK